MTELVDESTLIGESFEIVAERAGDIVPAVFERFFAMDESAHELMRHSDQHMQGRMFEAVLELLMTDTHFGPGGYLEWELDNHIDAYDATAQMYDALFGAVLELVETTLGSDWNEQYAVAWRGRIDRIMSQVHSH